MTKTRQSRKKAPATNNTAMRLQIRLTAERSGCQAELDHYLGEMRKLRAASTEAGQKHYVGFLLALGYMGVDDDE